MPSDLLTQLQPFAIALAIGLVIGIERERSHPPGQQPLGSRTFVLFSLMGALAARLADPFISVALTIFVGAVVIAGYWRSSRHTESERDIGFTTEVAAVLTYGLGYLAHREGFIAILIGVVTLVVLMARTRLHIFSRHQLKPKELEASAILLVVSTVIIPFLPNQTIDPWGFFDPQHFGLLILIILVLQFCAYLSIRIFGQSLGILLLGFLAGFVSSSSFTATISQKNYKKGVHSLIGTCAVILACSGMFLQALIIIYLVTPAFIWMVFFPIAVTGVLFALIALWLSRLVVDTSYVPETENPLSIYAAVKLSLLLVSMLFLVTLARHFFGYQWVYLVTFLGGLVEIRGVVLAISTLHQVHKINNLIALNNIILALSASFITKLIMVWTMGRKRFAAYSSGMLLFMLAIMLTIWGVEVSFFQTNIFHSKEAN